MVALILSLVAVVLGFVSFLFFILSNYDKLSKRYVTWRHDVDIKIGIRIPGRDEEFVEENPISYTDLADFDGELMFVLAVENKGDFDVDMDLTVAVEDPIKSTYEYYDGRSSIETPFNVRRTLDLPQRKYQYSTFTCARGSYSSGEQFLLILDPEDAELHILRSTQVELRGEIHADVSQFTIPGTDFNFPRNIGRARFEPIQEEYLILGPDHEDTADF